ncbi:MAG: alpha/beta hydrolase [Alphaproteobacteria bacterium]|nr:alpha/beta hydrolase [Alphaproteobacteria bacterium]
MPETTEPQTLPRTGGATIAYHRLSGKTPGVVFLGGFGSDMTGTKALAVEAFCKTRGHACLRFDYQGHGQSSGDFTDGTIGSWTEDALAAFDACTEGPQVLVGSSMGGWIMLLVALARKDRVAGLLGIAAAPDFTEDLIGEKLNAAQRAALARDGFFDVASDDAETPTRITQKLIEEGKAHLLLRQAIPLDCPVWLLHGMADADVPWETSLRLLNRLQSDDVTATFIRHGDHRLSGEDDIRRLEQTLGALLDSVA